MRSVDVGIYKVECDEDVLTLRTEDVATDTVGVSSDDVEEVVDRVNVVFRESRVIVSFSQDEWKYLRGLIDALTTAPVDEVETSSEEEVVEAPVAEVAAPAATSRRGRRRI